MVVHSVSLAASRTVTGHSLARPTALIFIVFRAVSSAVGLPDVRRD
jgi:hypothetical protein